jgi:tripartite-type tricarboxylate transporter receptor subunit TctC
MDIARRSFLHLTATIAALPAASRIANAQAYPNKPIHMIVGYPAGGVNDIYARLMTQWLSERLGQSFIVENRTGAAGTIAVDALALHLMGIHFFCPEQMTPTTNLFIRR